MISVLRVAKTPQHGLGCVGRGCSVVDDLSEVAVPPWGEDLLVAAWFGGVVGVWSVAGRARCAEFNTVYDFGGRRLALVPGERPVVVAGAWARHGVCGGTT